MATYKHNKPDVEKWLSPNPLIKNSNGNGNGKSTEGLFSKWKEKREIKKAEKEEYRGRGKTHIETTKLEGEKTDIEPAMDVSFQRFGPGGYVSPEHIFDPSKNIEKQLKKQKISGSMAENIRKNLPTESSEDVTGSSKSRTDIISKKKWGGEYKPKVKFELQRRSQLLAAGEGEKSSISMTRYTRKGKEKVKTKEVGDIGYKSLLRKRGRKLSRAGKKDLLPSEQKEANTPYKRQMAKEKEIQLQQKMKEKQKQLDIIKKSGSGSGMMPGGF